MCGLQYRIYISVCRQFTTSLVLLLMLAIGLLGKSLEESRRLHQTSVVAYAKASFRHAPSVTSWLYASRALKPADSRPPVLTTLVASRMHRFD
jgi:hypothetical protein